MADLDRIDIVGEIANGLSAFARAVGETARGVMQALYNLGGHYTDGQYADAMLAEHRAGLKRCVKLRTLSVSAAKATAALEAAAPHLAFPAAAPHLTFPAANTEIAPREFEAPDHSNGVRKEALREALEAIQVGDYHKESDTERSPDGRD